MLVEHEDLPEFYKDAETFLQQGEPDIPHANKMSAVKDRALEHPEEAPFALSVLVRFYAKQTRARAPHSWCHGCMDEILQVCPQYMPAINEALPNWFRAYGHLQAGVSLFIWLNSDTTVLEGEHPEAQKRLAIDLLDVWFTAKPNSTESLICVRSHAANLNLTEEQGLKAAKDAINRISTIFKNCAIGLDVTQRVIGPGQAPAYIRLSL